MSASFDNANPACDFCQEASGVCTECGGCFGEHCACDPCQHGKARADECVFCSREAKAAPTIAEDIFYAQG